MSIDSIITPEAPSRTPTQSPPQSRAQFRKQKRLSNHAPTIEIAIISNPSPLPRIPLARPPAPLTTTTMPPPPRLLIASIGNPAPYLSTLHSAGHTVLHALSSALSMPLRKSSRDWASGLLAQSDEPAWTLWASPVNMNVSGAAVASAWKAFLALSRDGGEPRLVVLHDELEAPLGSVKVRSGALSSKGHNGLKSIREKMPGVQYMRIGIGIGRPEARDPATVAGYVLRKMTAVERGKIEGAVGGVLGELRRLSGG